MLVNATSSALAMTNEHKPEVTEAHDTNRLGPPIWHASQMPRRAVPPQLPLSAHVCAWPNAGHQGLLLPCRLHGPESHRGSLQAHPPRLQDQWWQSAARPISSESHENRDDKMACCWGVPVLQSLFMCMTSMIVVGDSGQCRSFLPSLAVSAAICILIPKQTG